MKNSKNELCCKTQKTSLKPWAYLSFIYINKLYYFPVLNKTLNDKSFMSIYTKRHLFFSMLFIWRRVDMRLILLYNLNLETKKTEQNILSDSSFYAWWYMITITAIAVLIESRILKRSEKFNRLHYWKLKNVFISRGKFLNII